MTKYAITTLFLQNDFEQEVTAYFQSSEVANFYDIFYLEAIFWI